MRASPLVLSRSHFPRANPKTDRHRQHHDRHTTTGDLRTARSRKQRTAPKPGDGVGRWCRAMVPVPGSPAGNRDHAAAQTRRRQPIPTTPDTHRRIDQAPEPPQLLGPPLTHSLSLCARENRGRPPARRARRAGGAELPGRDRATRPRPNSCRPPASFLSPTSQPKILRPPGGGCHRPRAASWLLGKAPATVTPAPNLPGPNQTADLTLPPPPRTASRRPPHQDRDRGAGK
jgi:hypothetical protein